MDLHFKYPWETLPEFRKRVLKLQSAANKRLKRLEQAGLTNSPAYQYIVEELEFPRFSVKNKSHNEVISQFWKLKRFLESETGSVSGYKKVLEQRRKMLKISKTKDYIALEGELHNYFAFTKVLEDYYKQMGNLALALDYRRIWQVVSTTLKTGKTTITELKNDVDSFKQATNKILQQLGAGSLTQSMQVDVNKLVQEFEIRAEVNK